MSPCLEEQEWLEHLPYLLVTPVLAQNVGQIVLSWKVEGGDKFSGNDLANMMEGQCIVPLVELGMRHHGAAKKVLLSLKM